MADDMDSCMSPDANGSVDFVAPNENHPPQIPTKPAMHRDSYWFAQGGPEDVKNISKSIECQKEREERIRQFREQQEGERVKKMKELEQSVMMSRKHREQQEEERRRKIEEAKLRENERRQQVEERKRLIWEAEQERKEAILRRNLEREARIEARRNAQRNSLCFAFGSSTPRTFDLDLAALGRNPSAGSALMSAVSGRRSEEREQAPKRATSACSLDRKPDSSDYDANSGAFWRSESVEREADDVPKIDHMNSERTKACLTMDDCSPSSFSGQSSGFYHNCSPSGWLVGSGAVVGDDCMSWSMISLSSSSSRGRRRTDLVPMVSRERSTTPHTRPRAKDTSRSPSRPQSSMSGRSEISITSSQASAVILRPKPAPRKPRPVSMIERPTWDASDKKPRMNENSVSTSKMPRTKTNETENPIKNAANMKKPVPPPKSAQVLAKARTQPVPTKDNLRKIIKVPPEQKPAIDNNNVPNSEMKETLLTTPQESSATTCNEPHCSTVAAQHEGKADDKKPVEAEIKSENQENIILLAQDKESESSVDTNQSMVGDSVQVKQRITSEEEARAALAEKRRLAREQAERESELERQRQEELKRQEEERKRLEELEQRRLEEEQMQLAELHRKLEEEKLKKAIEEQRVREQEEQEKRDEEARLKAEKDEQERKAREEAEKQRLELEEKLRKEEQERAERKKRVEQIMSRTRGSKGSQSSNAIKEFSAETTSVISSSRSASDFESNALSKSNVVVVQSQSFQHQVHPFGMDDLVRSENVKNGFHSDSVEPSHLRSSAVPNRTCNVETTCNNMQTNGYNSHEETSATSSPEERSDSSGSLLLVDLQTPANNVTNGQSSDEKTSHSHNDNYVIDVVNSNIVSSNNPFLSFEDNLSKKQENTYTDLLS